MFDPAVPDAADVVLRDGSTVRLRPLTSSDEQGLRAFYQRLSPESLHNRFAGARQLDAVVSDALASLKDPHACSLIAEAGDHLVAIGQYFPTEDGPSTRVEVAFAIADVRQGRGIGTRLLERLALIARSRGIDTFEAFVLADNRRMRDVFSDSGFDVTWDRAGAGTLHLLLSLEETPALDQKTAARAREAATASLKPFFEPRTVAVIGAGRSRGGIGSEIFHNLRATGFSGTVHPVNPAAADVDGLRAYPRVSAIPGDVDLAIIVVPAQSVAAAVDDCIAKGVRALLVISAGFAETGPEGRARETAILDRVRAAGIRMIGPNCMGIINTDPGVRLNATFSPVFPPEGRLGLSTQSGALGLAILDYATRLNIGFSTFVSIGNKADVSSNDLIQYWAEDPRTDAILLYLESFGNPRKFSELARHIGRRKPIVAVKAGRSSAGARAASSHTGAIATSDAIVDALFRQAGVIRTYTLEELFDVAALLAHQPIPRGRRVAILTNAGGPGILAADACEANGLELPTLESATLAGLREFLPAAASLANPIDMLASAPAEHYERALRLLLADGRVDSVLTIFIPPLVTDPSDVAAAIVRAVGTERVKPVLATVMRAQGAPRELATVPCYMFPEAAATALSRIVAHGEWRRRPSGVVPKFDDLDSATARRIVERMLETGGGWLSPADAGGILAAFGIPNEQPNVAATEEEAVAVAARLGGRVALKAVGPGILHKTDIGAVRLGLAGEGAVRAAYREMTGRLGSAISTMTVQRMVDGGVEALIGATRDPSFGHVIGCGIGGTLVQLFADVTLRLPPLTDVDAREMIDDMKGAPLLRGYRGADPVDESALRDALLRLSALIELCPEIEEIDVNPLKVLSRGVCAVDVRIRVERPRPVRSRRIQY